MLYYVYSSVAEQLEFDWSIKESTAFKEANCKQRGRSYDPHKRLEATKMVQNEITL